MTDLIIIGAGDFGREVIWLIEEINKKEMQYNILGFVDDAEKLQGQSIRGYSVLGDLHYLDKLSKQQAVNAVVALQSCEDRKKIVNQLTHISSWVNLIHPSALIANDAIIGFGNIISANCVISVNSNMGNHCLLNFGCILGHDVVLEDYVSIMSHSTLSGHVKVGHGSYLGTNVSVVPGIKIGSKAKIGVSSVVIRNVKDNVTVMGNPAKLLKL